MLQLTGEIHSSGYSGCFFMVSVLLQINEGRMKYTRLITVSLISNRTKIFGLLMIILHCKYWNDVSGGFVSILLCFIFM